MDPFTNQPYAFDDTSSELNPREVEFNNGIREITVRKKMKDKLYYILCNFFLFVVDTSFSWLRFVLWSFLFFVVFAKN